MNIDAYYARSGGQPQTFQSPRMSAPSYLLPPKILPQRIDVPTGGPMWQPSDYGPMTPDIYNQLNQLYFKNYVNGTYGSPSMYNELSSIMKGIKSQNQGTVIDKKQFGKNTLEDKFADLLNQQKTNAAKSYIEKTVNIPQQIQPTSIPQQPQPTGIGAPITQWDNVGLTPYKPIEKTVNIPQQIQPTSIPQQLQPPGIGAPITQLNNVGLTQYKPTEQLKQPVYKNNLSPQDIAKINILLKRERLALERIYEMERDQWASIPDFNTWLREYANYKNPVSIDESTNVDNLSISKVSTMELIPYKNRKDALENPESFAAWENQINQSVGQVDV